MWQCIATVLRPTSSWRLCVNRHSWYPLILLELAWDWFITKNIYLIRSSISLSVTHRFSFFLFICLFLPPLEYKRQKNEHAFIDFALTKYDSSFLHLRGRFTISFRRHSCHNCANKYGKKNLANSPLVGNDKKKKLLWLLLYVHFNCTILIAYVIDVENENHVMQLKCIFNDRCVFNLIEYFIERMELIEYYHTF